VNRACARFGAINGVIHAAGIAGGGMIQLKTNDIAESVLAPKVQGAITLVAALRDVPLDLVVFCSSLASILGGFGQVDYCGANAFLDAFASSQTNRDDSLVISINWDAWQEVGMAVNTPLPPNLRERRAEGLRNGILTNEGAEVFERILNSSLPQVAVSTVDLPARIQEYATPVSPNATKEESSKPVIAQPGHARPELGTTFAQPRNEIEQTLARIWQQLLGVAQIGIDDDFFELGGHSLLAVQLMSAIEKEFGQRIPLVGLFQHATVKSLAELLRKDVASLSWPTFVEIQPSGSRLPLFCVSTPNVNALGYRALARCLGQDQPVYGLQAQYPEDLDGEHSQKAVDDLATDYLEALHAMQPKGPYQFIGMCRGAHIAYEMARRLEAKGENVALMGVLDTWVIENTYNRFLYVRYYYRRLKSMLHLSTVEKIKLLKRKLAGAKSSAQSSAASSAGPPAQGRNPLHIYFPGPEFVPRTYDGKIRVFRARRQPLDRIRDRELGWGKLALGGVDVHIVPGDHGTVLEEANVAGLAEELKKCLNESLRP